MNDQALTVREVLPAEYVDPAQDALEVIERRTKLFDQLMGVAIRATSPSDWIDQNGKPYLQGSGAEKVARRFGVRIYDTVIEREHIEDENGKYYLYTVTGKAAFGSGSESVEVIGTCSSRDKFFGRANGENKATADVDIGNIKKKAYTNFLGNAITRLLGIRNLTWDALEAHGITKEGKASVTYKNKKTDTPKTQPTNTGEKKPFWKWDGNDGNTLISATVGTHFSAVFLKGCGMKQGSKPTMFTAKYSDGLWTALSAQYEAKPQGDIPDQGQPDLNDIFPPEPGAQG
jgi:hypothetical protein